MSRKRLHQVLSLLTVAGTALAGYNYLDLSSVLEAWRSFSWGHLACLSLLPALYLLAKANRFVGLMAPVSEGQPSDIRVGYAASQSASLLPGGVAFRVAMMQQLGVPPERSAGPVLLNSASDQMLLFLAGLFLSAWYPQLRVPAAVMGGLLLTIWPILRSDKSRRWCLKRLRKLAATLRVSERLERGLDHLTNLWQPKVLSRAMGWTVLANSISLLSLCLVVHGFGFPVDVWALAAAFAIPNLLGRLSPLPAGAGVTEAGMVALIAHRTNLSLNDAAATVALFRIVDVVLPAAYGFALYHSRAWQSRAREACPSRPATA